MGCVVSNDGRMVLRYPPQSSKDVTVVVGGLGGTDTPHERAGSVDVSLKRESLCFIPREFESLKSRPLHLHIILLWARDHLRSRAEDTQDRNYSVYGVAMATGQLTQNRCYYYYCWKKTDWKTGLSGPFLSRVCCGGWGGGNWTEASLFTPAVVTYKLPLKCQQKQSCWLRPGY